MNKKNNSDDCDECSESREESTDDAAEPIEADKLIIFSNPEKKGTTRLGVEEYMPNATSRILMSGMPGSGKRNLIFNIIHRMRPPPSCIHLVHHDPETIEYNAVNDMGIPLLIYDPEDMPTMQNIENPFDEDPAPSLNNPLIIFDEITTDSMGKKGTHRFERLVNHTCTHKNATMICSIQSMMNIPAKARRGFNHFALWKQADKLLNKLIADKASIRPETLEDMFELCKDKFDFIYIDLDSPHDGEWRYRLNFIEPISIVPIESAEIAAQDADGQKKYIAD